MQLGQYSNYTHNPNGFYNCIPPIPCYYYYQLDSPWATFRGNNPNFYGRSVYNLPINPPSLKYQSNLGYFDTSLIIDKDGNIYCSSNNPYLYCFTPNLQLKWKFYAGDDFSNTYVNCCIGCDGTIYFASYKSIENKSKLYSINPDGTLKWSVNLDGDLGETNILIGLNQNIFICTYYNPNSFVYIVNQKGIIIRKISIENDNLNGWNASLDIHSKLFFITGYNNFYIVDITKETYLTIPIQSSGLYSTPVYIGDYVYVATGSVSPSVLYKFNKFNGNLDASFTTNGFIDSNSPIVDSDNNIYIGISDTFYKFDKNLNVLWSYNISGAYFIANSAIISKNNLILIIDWNTMNLICLDKNGNVIWIKPSGLKNTYCTPGISNNGLFYIATSDGISAFG